MKIIENKEKYWDKESKTYFYPIGHIFHVDGEKVIVEEGFCEDCIFSTDIDNCHMHQCCFEINDKIKFVAFKRLKQ